MAIALHTVERDEEAARCPVCGGDSTECQDPRNEHAYQASFKRCYRTLAVSQAGASRSDDANAKRALVASTTFHTERVKPAQ